MEPTAIPIPTSPTTTTSFTSPTPCGRQANESPADPMRWERLQELYFRISALPESEQPAALESSCGDDPGLRGQLAGLLGLTAPTGDVGGLPPRVVPTGFLAEPALGLNIAAAAPDARQQEDLVGQMLGVYRIERLIARGGMGEVYAAVRDDGQMHYRVAVKVVKRGLDTADVLRRFRAERQTLANLNHPNIARLLDGGATPDGRPYLVLEYVEGERIDEYCRKAGLNTIQRLRLFMDVCSAVHYAHQNLVVHRDIKPGNIMVMHDPHESDASRGTVKLLDFGIARLLEPDGSGAALMTLTRIEDRRLTPEYASPEQFEGLSVTTATDIYSLGVVLYEMLTGTGPYELTTRTTEAMRRIVCRQAPVPPSVAVGRIGRQERGDREATRRLRRTLKRDLDNIVLMALRKEPHRRYATVEQFARDVDRFLRGLPVMARKDTFAYRAGKFVTRNALLTGGTAAAVIALAGMSALAQWKAMEAARQRDEAFVARDQAEEITDFLRGILAAADPALKGPQTTVGELLASAALVLDGELTDRPLVRSALRAAIGSAYVGLGQYDEARAHLEEAYATRLELLGPDHHDVAESRFEMAVLEYHLQRFTEAEELLRLALASFVKLRGEQNADVARMLNSLGAVLRASGRLDEAMEVYSQALEVRQRIHGADHLSVAETHNNLAGVFRERQDMASAIKSSELALAIRRRHLGNDHALVGQSIGNLAVMLHQQGDLDRAEVAYREALEVMDRTYPREHPGRAMVLSSLATLLRMRGDLEGEEPLLRETLEIRLATLPPGDRRTAHTGLRLAACLLELHRLDEAQEALLQMIPVVPGDHPDYPVLNQIRDRLEGAMRPVDPGESTPAHPVEPESLAAPTSTATTPADGGG
jgi:eukaryotic-like serine/threonine-protein kinase